MVFVNVELCPNTVRFVPNVTLVRLKVRHVRVVNFQAVTIYFEGVTGAENLFLSKLNPEGTVRYPLEDIPLVSSAQ